MAGTDELSARQRARAAQAKRLAARAAKDKRVEDLYTHAFKTFTCVAAARAAVKTAELQLARAIAALGAEGETQQLVSEALELPADEIRRLARIWREATDGSGSTAAVG